ncbi:MAG TPA: DUF488 domain-containing protein, partial [Thermomicrobiales bacterium]|nr:DUF488 domain-containing protein [Thermomicrobiales bacterium]
MAESNVRIFTIGHSNLTFDAFVALLANPDAPIATVVDVRSAPYSRFAPQFNRPSLEAGLRAHGIAYRYLGDDLGGRPTDPTCYVSGQVPDGKADYLQLVDYAEVARRPWFQQGLDRLLAEAASGPTAIMCSEEDPHNCHRHHLIAKALTDRGIEARHIRKDG